VIKISAQEFAQVVGGKLQNLSENFVIDQLPIINSSAARKGTFFAAFIGNNVDGHEYVTEAIKGGAAFALVTRQVDEPSILVKDTGEALIDLAKYVRNKINGLQVIGITGSHGKTTTKEFLYAILKSEGATVATEGNFNTEIGVPLTILNCTEQTKYCIIEMGARHKGDILKLTKLANPNVGIVLVVGTAHIGEIGSVGEIAKTKGELIAGLSEGSTAVLGSYDQWTPRMADGLNLKKLVFGDNHDVRAADIEIHGGYAHFDLVTPAGRNSVALQVIGEQQIPNALAAAAAAYALGISNENIATGLTVAKLDSKWRMQVESLHGIQIINDFYNANPESMKAALKTLVLLSQESGGSSWAILGKMHELGQIEATSHLEIVKYCQDLDVDHLVSVGTDLYKESSTEMNDRNLLLHQCKNTDAVLELVNNFSAGDVVLLKASRAEKFEDLANAVKSKWSGVNQ
jgi:UDP-N-acetylmuramoyl-tripeptide--D-alanyl-D-alanine ligase